MGLKRSKYGDVRWKGHVRPAGPNGRYHFDNAMRNQCSVYEPVMEDNEHSPVQVVKREDGQWDVLLFGDVVSTTQYKSEAQSEAEELLS